MLLIAHVLHVLVGLKKKFPRLKLEVVSVIVSELFNIKLSNLIRKIPKSKEYNKIFDRF